MGCDGIERRVTVEMRRGVKPGRRIIVGYHMHVELAHKTPV